MDGIAALAVSTFELVQKFKEPNEDSLYHAVQVGISATDSRPDSGHPVHDGQGHEPTISQCEYEMPASTLPGWFAGNEGLTESQQDASFKAVQINRNEDVSLEISQECFAQLFEAMRADPAVKYMVCHDYDGFHEFGAPGYLKTRFIGTPIYALLWTFDPVEVATRALFIRRRHKPFSMFTRVLRAFHEHIYTPWLPGFVSCYLIQQWSDRETSGFELLVLREVEMETGFGPHPSGFSGLQPGGMEGKFDINVLTSWSQRVNEVSGNIGNKIRHQKISMTVLKMIVEASQTKTDKIASEFIAQKQRQSLDELSRAVPFLERQLNTYVDFLAYLKDRADKLSAVVSINITLYHTLPMRYHHFG
jgi:hypothetical protein